MTDCHGPGPRLAHDSANSEAAALPGRAGRAWEHLAQRLHSFNCFKLKLATASQVEIGHCLSAATRRARGPARDSQAVQARVCERCSSHLCLNEQSVMSVQLNRSARRVHGPRRNWSSATRAGSTRLACFSNASYHKLAATAEDMGASQCGNDRPGLGVNSVTQKLRIIRV